MRRTLLTLRNHSALEPGANAWLHPSGATAASVPDTVAAHAAGTGRGPGRRLLHPDADPVHRGLLAGGRHLALQLGRTPRPGLPARATGRRCRPATQRARRRCAKPSRPSQAEVGRSCCWCSPPPSPGRRRRPWPPTAAVFIRRRALRLLEPEPDRQLAASPEADATPSSWAGPEVAPVRVGSRRGPRGSRSGRAHGPGARNEAEGSRKPSSIRRRPAAVASAPVLSARSGRRRDLEAEGAGAVRPVATGPAVTTVTPSASRAPRGRRRVTQTPMNSASLEPRMAARPR